MSAQDAPAPDGPVTAATAPEAAASEARALFAQGVALAGQERWGDAIAYFRRSRALVERSGTVFNIAVALVRLGRASEALEALGDFLRLADPAVDAERIAEATRMQTLVRTTVARLELEVSPADALLQLDGSPRAERGRTRAISLDPGRHALVLSAADHATRRLDLALLPGETTRVAVDLTPTTGRLIVRATPVDVRVRVDGAIADTTTDTSGSLSVALAPGPHQIRLEAEGCEPSERNITLRAGTRTTLLAHLARERPTLLESPIFWLVTGVVAASAGVAIGVAASGTEAPYGGSTGIILGD